MIVGSDSYADNPSWNIISKLFNLSKKEFVYDDFGCSLWNKILIPGHLYCMENHICFYADMMGTESKVIISMDDIEELNKKSSLGFIKNAIEIVCKNKKSYYFTAFSDRDGVYDLISGIWKGTPKEKTSNKVEESGLRKQSDGIRLGNGEEKNKESQGDAGNKEKDDEVKEIVVLPVTKGGEKEGTNVEFLKIMFPISIEKFFENFISDDAVFSNKERLQIQDSMYDIVVQPWKLNEESGLHTRDIDFMMKIADIPFGPNKTRVHCSQTYKKTENLLEVIRMSQSLDVPYGTSFQLEEKWTVTAVEGSPNKCLFRSSGSVIFLKSCTFGSMIKSRSIKEMQKDQDLWFKTVKERKIIPETSPQNRKKELKHEIERAEESSLNRDGIYDNRIKKDLMRVGKVEEQVVLLRKGLKLLGVLLLVAIVLFMLSLLLLNRKLTVAQAKIDYLESLECHASKAVSQNETS